jgi:hypothetical protein
MGHSYDGTGEGQAGGDAVSLIAKRAYTSFVPTFWRPGRENQDEFFTRADGYLASLGESELAARHQLAAERSLADGICARHLFLTSSDFVAWLQECGQRPLPEHVEALSELLGHDMLVLHFPCSSQMKSLIVDLPQSSQSPDLCFICYSRDEARRIGCESRWLAISKPEVYFDARFPHTHDAVKLIVGLALYLSAFPETLKDGLPDDLKHPSHHAHNNAFTVAISEKVRAVGTHNSPMPHFRVGHFRVLRSEKFTNKRFQAVFVHGTFVKGKAATVLSPEQTKGAAA